MFKRKMLCSECGSENVASIDELARVRQLQDVFFNNLEWTWLNEEDSLKDFVEIVYRDRASRKYKLEMIKDNPIQWRVIGKRVLRK